MSTDWSPLADVDPVPGDPVAVGELARRHAQAAEQSAEQARALRAVGRTDHWEGAAADAYAACASGLPAQAEALATRFDRIGRALAEFAPALEAAQRQARAALARAREAQERAGVGHSQLPAVVLVPGVLPDRERELCDELVRARRLLEHAVEQRDRAASRCARAVAAAADDSLRDPHGWRRLLLAASRVAGSVSAWLGVAALVLCWVPGLGQVLGAAALTAAAVTLLADAALVGSGDRSGRDLLLDVVGVVPAGRALRLAAFRPASAPVLRALAAGARHGLPVPEARAGIGQIAAAVRAGRSARSWPDFLRSPGGIADEVARARRLGRGGQVLVAGGHGLDLGQAAYALGGQLRPGRPR